jgi:Holliday junction resolvasome RuvABC DNA-binding subunit
LDQVLAAILGNDFKALKSPGVGEKIAKRIVIEMTSKIEKLGLDIDAAPAGIIHNPVDELEQELVAAMESLGYARKDIIALIAKTDFSAEADIQTKIRKLLSLLR